jgi:hypothetical protein
MSNQDAAHNENGNPPYKCEPTAVDGVCLKYYWNPADQAYNLPPGGERLNCQECQYYF